MDLLLSPAPPVEATPRALPPARPPERLADDAAALAAARRLAARFASDAALRDRTRRLPWAELDAFVASGLWAISVPRAFGGTDVSSTTLAEVVAIISAADGSLGQIPQNHFFALEALRCHGGAAQQCLLFGRVLAGERLGNALAEIGHKDFQRRTQLVPDVDGDGWRLDGRKFYCTGALYAHWIPTLSVRSEGGAPRHVLAFVPRDAQGVAITDDWDGFGQRVTGSGSVTFEGVRVRDEWVVPYAPTAEEPTTAGLLAQLLHAAIDLGLGQGALAAALELPRGNLSPEFARQVGELDLQLRAAQALMRRAGSLVDAARAAPDVARVAAASTAVAEARALTTTAALAASSQLFELAGPGSALEHLGLDRFWRNVRTHTLHDPLRWRVHAVGNYHLNGTPPPRHGAI